VVLRPDLATFRIVPWEPATAAVVCDAYDEHGVRIGVDTDEDPVVAAAARLVSPRRSQPPGGGARRRVPEEVAAAHLVDELLRRDAEQAHQVRVLSRHRLRREQGEQVAERGIRVG